MTLNKTEQELMNEIAAKGYTSVEHGRGFNRHSHYGARRVKARNSLIQKGLIKVTHQGKETDARRGFSSYHFWSRIELA